MLMYSKLDYFLKENPRAVARGLIFVRTESGALRRKLSSLLLGDKLWYKNEHVQHCILKIVVLQTTLLITS